MRDAAKALLASCSAHPADVGGQKAPSQALALLRLWDGLPGGLTPAQCRQHAAQVWTVTVPRRSGPRIQTRHNCLCPAGSQQSVTAPCSPLCELALPLPTIHWAFLNISAELSGSAEVWHCS